VSFWDWLFSRVTPGPPPADGHALDLTPDEVLAPPAFEPAEGPWTTLRTRSRFSGSDGSGGTAGDGGCGGGAGC
jgi:hypothetical protein